MNTKLIHRIQQLIKDAGPNAANLYVHFLGEHNEDVTDPIELWEISPGACVRYYTLVEALNIAKK